MSAQGQDRGDGEEDESTIGRTREGRSEGVEEGPHLLGQLLMVPVDLVSSLRAFWACCRRRNGVAALGTGECGADRLEWPWQPPCVRCRAYLPSCTKEAHLPKPRKRQKSSLGRASFPSPNDRASTGASADWTTGRANRRQTANVRHAASNLR